MTVKLLGSKIHACFSMASYLGVLSEPFNRLLASWKYGLSKFNDRQVTWK